MIKNKKQVSESIIEIIFMGKSAALIKVCVFAFAFMSLGVLASAQTAMVTENYVAYPGAAPENGYVGSPNYQCQTTPSIVGNMVSTGSYNRSFISSTLLNGNNVSSMDPWVNSALIEYDVSTPGSFMPYPGACLTFCAEVTCANPVRKVNGPDNTGVFLEASGDFPIQSILFEIFKYQKNSNPYNPDSTPSINTIALYPQDNNICRGVSTTGGSATDPASRVSCCDSWPLTGSGCDSNATFKSKSDCFSGVTRLSFCAPWDGMYEIEGEHGKSNGQFGYRTTIASEWPGDGVSTPNISIKHTIVYPGEAQIPIQVDVTDVHSVRSTTTLVGAKVAVAAQPYNISYRLSKDSLATISIYDPSVGISGPTGLLRQVIKDQPALGEGTPGGPDKIDTVTTNVDSWDGRDNSGRLLPYGNYVISVQAKSQDEWTGISKSDVARGVTRQISLDPLKITDLTITGLAKTSTAYAMLSYMVTEPASVHVSIYTPGTRFDQTTVPTTGTAAPVVVNGTGFKVAQFDEQKASRVNVNTKWDGMCQDVAGCASAGYAKGSPLPDGDYVYVIWAEIPYTGDNAASTQITVNGVTWDGVRTNKFYNGILPINRGLPEITIQPVGYSTIGSSPTAFGLDPFIFRFSLSRDSYVTAEVVTTGANGDGTAANPDTTYVVKTLIDNQPQVANNINMINWDGKDNLGRYPSSGNYMFRVTVKDSLFPDKQVTSTVEFPLDMYRIVDVSTTPILGDATSQATINYSLSKSMNIDVSIFDKSVVIPNNIRTSQWPPQSCTATPAPGDLATATCLYYEPSSGRNDYPIKPIKTFRSTRPGEGQAISEPWDGMLYDTNNSGQQVKGDGMYPYYISANSDTPTSQYYKISSTTNVPVPQAPVLVANMGATDRPTGYITIARGPVYFMSIDVKGSNPKLYYTSETVSVPEYLVSFAVTRTATVKVEILSTEDNMCLGGPAYTVCRTLTIFSSGGTDSIYDPVIINKLNWDGKDSKGNYVKTSAYNFRFTANPYPKPVGGNAVEETIATRTININNFQIFDRFIWDAMPATNGAGKFAYQISVPMKVAIQIFKPGTRIANPQTGTLLNPANPNGPEVDENNVKEVLVRALIGFRGEFRPLEDTWDGLDYAGQKVPDGKYPYRYVTVLDGYDMDPITGSVRTVTGSVDQSVQNLVADWDKFINLGDINVTNGDSLTPEADWKDKNTTKFFPNPLRQSFGQFEITKVPAPGLVNIKIYNIAGDLVRESGYECINARGITATLDQINASGGLTPEWTITGAPNDPVVGGGRNFALRCTWDRTNQSGKKVARGLYYAIMELNPNQGNASKTQRVIKILIP